MKIAITAPTGNIGSKIAARLLDEGGHEVTLLARNPEKLKDQQEAGAKVVACDLIDASQVKGATAGMDALFWLNPPNFAAEDFRAWYNQLNDVGCAAVKTNNIKHTVFLSSVGGHLTEGSGVVLGLHDGEKKFTEATQGLSILRPAWFMENYFHQISTIKEMGQIFLPIGGDKSLPMVATGDIAERATNLLTGPAPDSPDIHSLHGPRDYSYDECAKIIGETIGKDVKHVQVPPEATKDALLKIGASSNTADMLNELYAGVQNGTMVDEQERYSATTTPTKFETFAAWVLGPMLG